MPDADHPRPPADDTGRTEAQARRTDDRTGRAPARTGRTDDRTGRTSTRAGRTDDRTGRTSTRAGRTDSSAGRTDDRTGRTDSRTGRADDRLGSVLDSVDGVVFDTDGVLLDSARLHAAAWKATFDALLGHRDDLDRDAARPFGDADYRRYVDGKSRLDGAGDFLVSRGIHLPEGGAEDPPGEDSVRAVAAAKDALFSERMRTDGVEVWPGTWRLLRALAAAEVPCAAVSASRHAGDLLERTGLGELLRVVVDGVEAARLGLAGKPAPDLFLAGAARLDTRPSRTAVVEDALAGVAAGRAGDFGLVVGVDRTADGSARDDLRAHGADLVVTDLSGLLEPARAGRARGRTEGPEGAA